MDDFLSRIAKCETRVRRLGLLFFTLVPLLALSLLGLAWRERQHVLLSDSMRLKELVIVDDQGIVRARAGGQLPDPVINGKTVSRGQQIAGILLYDDTEQERGGYVTFSPSGNVALTLDTRQRQVALFVAGPNDGAAARLWQGNDFIEMRSDPTGSRINAVRSNQLVVQQPPLSDTDTENFCSAFKDELSKASPQPSAQETLRSCSVRMPEAACRKCLGLAR